MTPITRITRWRWLIVLLLLLFPMAPVEAQEAALLRKEALSDPSPGALSQPQGGAWTLLSDEEGGKLLGRITWADPANRTLLELEAASTLQKGADEVELLNLDGLGGGDTSIKGKWSRSWSWLREGIVEAKGDLLPLCDDINSVLEHQLASIRSSPCSEKNHCKTIEVCTAASHGFEPIPKEACTLETLQAIGGEWATEAEQAARDAAQLACDELAKVNPDLSFYPAGYELLPGTRLGPNVRYCTEVDVRNAARQTFEDVREQVDAVIKTLADLIAVRDKLVATLARLDAEFASASTLEERTAIATARYATEAEIESVDAKITEEKAKRKKISPDILTGFELWLKGKKEEKLEAVCKRYNRPDRSIQLVTMGNDTNCNTEAIPRSIAAIESPRLRSALYKRFISSIPVAVTYATLSTGASNHDFKYVDAESLTTIETFDELESLVTRESETSTSLGAAWSAQVGNHFVSIGYERRNKYVANSATEICAPVAADGTSMRCLETITGAPTKIDQNLGLAEWRTYLTGNLGLKLRAFYVDTDFRRRMQLDNEWEFHGLLYFLQHKEKGLNGGLDIAYDTAFKDLSARVFIGQRFEIFE